MKILVIRRDNIGDLVCTTPLIAALRDKYPQAAIYALVNDYNKDVLDGHPLLDGVYFYTKLKHRQAGDSVVRVIWRKLMTYLALRREHFDYAIVAGSGYPKNAVRLAKAARPKHVISFVSEGTDYDAIVDYPIPFTRDHVFRHEVECLAELLVPLGVTQAPGKLSLPPVVVPDVLARRFSTKQRPVIALHISARENSRVWAVEHFCEVIRSCLSRDVDFLLLWAPGAADDPRHPGDDEKANYIRSQFPDHERLVFYPTRTVKDLMAAFSCADLAVCSDGGGLHLAAGSGACVVGLFEHLEKKTKHWYPWQVPHRVLTSGSEQDWQVGHIPVQAVVDAIDDLLPQAAGVSRD